MRSYSVLARSITTTQLQLGRASRAVSLGGMAVGGGMQMPGVGSSTNPPFARIPPFKVVWAVLECCRASPLPTRTSRNLPRSPGTHTLSPNDHGSSFRQDTSRDQTARQVVVFCVRNGTTASAGTKSLKLLCIQLPVPAVKTPRGIHAAAAACLNCHQSKL